MPDFKLSICIPTLNRGRWIGDTLASIVPQLTPEMEIVIVDGGSTDDTAAIVARFAKRAPIRYIRREEAQKAPSNEGFDRDVDYAVRLARGEHCWLFTDDDLLIPGAVAEVMAELADGEPDLLVVDAEVRDITMRRVFEPKRMRFVGRRDYGPADHDALLADSGDALSFVGAAVVRRSCWIARDTERYYGTSQNHVGVIFQLPYWERARVLGRSLVQIRMGNAFWTARAFDIWMFIWPQLIWGFEGYSDAAKAAVTPREPWRTPIQLFLYRAYGSYRRAKYRERMQGLAEGRVARAAAAAAVLPGSLVHMGVTAYLAYAANTRGSVMYNLLTVSPFSNPVSRWIAAAGQRREERRDRAARA